MLLQFLAMRQGQVVSREEIWKHLYARATSLEQRRRRVHPLFAQ
jgi:DNA-binding response OmpR family regulator